MRDVITWVALLGIFVLLAGATGYAWWFVYQEKIDVAAVQASRQREPSDLQSYTAWRGELAARQVDIDRIRAALITRDDIGQVVSTIEAEASRRGVTVQIPAVEEKVTLDESGKPVNPTAPLQEIRLELVGSGTPEALTQLLYSIEHVSPVAYLESWSVRSDPRTRPQGLASRASVETGARQENEGILQANLIIAVLADPAALHALQP